MPWKNLNTIEQLNEIDQGSAGKPALIFKHSTRCSISSTALNRMNGGLERLSDKMDTYYLDLLTYRSISNEIESRYHVDHESPQVLLIRNGTCIYSTSHLDINPSTIIDQVQ
jgi:bacillithiol system protein YtxJ